MNLSAILVITTPSKLEDCKSLLSRQPGLCVHHFESETGKIILTQEAQSVEDEVEGLKRIKGMDGVLIAEMIYHYFEDDESLHAQMPPELNALQGIGDLPETLKKTK